VKNGCICLVVHPRLLLALGMPVAFAVGLSAVAGALWIDLPLEADDPDNQWGEQIHANSSRFYSRAIMGGGDHG
jgi:hypothetical protein